MLDLKSILPNAFSNIDNLCAGKNINIGVPEIYLSMLIFKYLDDFCESGIAIINELPDKLRKRPDMPDITMIQMCRTGLKMFYDEQCFNDEMDGIKSQLLKYVDKENNRYACKAVFLAQEEFKRKADVKVLEALKKRDKKYIYDNFDQIIGEIPMKENIVKFRELLKINIGRDNEDVVWEYLDSLVDFVAKSEKHKKHVK